MVPEKRHSVTLDMIFIKGGYLERIHTLDMVCVTDRQTTLLFRSGGSSR